MALLFQFAEKTPGMSRVMIGDALVLEHERLQERIKRFPSEHLQAALARVL